MDTPSFPSAVMRTFMAADGEMTTATFGTLGVDSTIGFTTASMTSLSDVTTLTNENGCFASSATNTTCLVTSASTSANTQTSCDTLCGVIGVLLDKYRYTNEICGDGFTEKAKDCLDCVSSPSGNIESMSYWQYRVQPAVDLCQKARADMVRLAGEIFGGIAGWAVLVIVVYVLLKRRRKKNRLRDAGPGAAAEVQQRSAAELAGESGWTSLHEMEARQLGHLYGKQILDNGQELNRVAGLAELPANEEVHRVDHREKAMVADGTMALGPAPT